MSRSSDYSSYGASPSVTKEKWMKHAIAKLSKGYNLIVSEERHVANFYKGFGDFESCSYKTARRLIKEGFVQKDGEDSMGFIYKLAVDGEVDVEGEANDIDGDEEETDLVVDEEVIEKSDIDDELEEAVDGDIVDDDIAVDI